MMGSAREWRYNWVVDLRAIEEFVRRDWQEAAASKRAYWAERFKHDCQATWEAAQLLLTHTRRVRSEFPTDRDRELDFASHLALRARLDRAAHAFTRR
ncbi:MAG: hypothetical protein HYX76_12515 [Acidobacteria bacterium]|nr:hypothetical protein [Acidobacteriota bacterium]